VFSALPQAIKLIVRDPINLLLALVPSLIALLIYALSIVAIYYNADVFASMFRNYLHVSDSATILARILAILMIVFVFVLMSWTFMIVVGIISAPFNSMLSYRIEKKLVLRQVETDQKRTWRDLVSQLGETFLNEFKKLIFIIAFAALAFVLNLFPLFYPLGLFIMSTLLAIQFVDYSWSRHDLHFGACLKDTLKNILQYSLSGFLFLLLIAVPLVNVLIPALATSYFTVLWINKQKHLQKI
jgi:CysZ protein